MTNKVLVRGEIKSFKEIQNAIQFVIINTKIVKNEIKKEEVLCVGYGSIKDSFKMLKIGDYVFVEGALRNNRTGMEVLTFSIELLKSAA
jgi:lysyl-tRNA synthetase class II